MNTCTQRVNGNKSQNYEIGQCTDNAVRVGGRRWMRAAGAAMGQGWDLARNGGLAQVNAFEFRNAL